MRKQRLLCGVTVVLAWSLAACAREVPADARASTPPATVVTTAVSIALNSPTAAAVSNELLLRAPLGPEGISYAGGEQPGSQRVGPTAFAVAPDGAFWVVDLVANRIVEFAATSERRRVIAAPANLTSIIDIGATRDGLTLLGWVSQTPVTVRVGYDGSEQTRTRLPALGVPVMSLAALQRATTPQTITFGFQNAPPPPGVTPTVAPRNRTVMTIGTRQIPVETRNDLNLFRLLYINADGSFYVHVEDLAADTVLLVDQTVRHYAADGTLLGAARVPIAERVTAVENGVAVGPDGSVYALVPRKNSVDIEKLVFSASLPPILPTPGAP